MNLDRVTWRTAVPLSADVTHTHSLPLPSVTSQVLEGPSPSACYRDMPPV